MKDRDPPRRKLSANPLHNSIDHEKSERERLQLYYHHKRAGTLETYYHMYNGDRPLRGRSGGNDR